MTHMHWHMMHFGLLGFGVGMVILLIVLFVHFLPSYVAFSRFHPARWAILLVNIFFGWTLIGWVITLVWALSAPPVIVQQGYPPYPPAGPGRF